MTLREAKRLLVLAGKMSDAARMVVGGIGLKPLFVSAANVHELSQCCEDLRKATDKYDRAILDLQVKK